MSLILPLFQGVPFLIVMRFTWSFRLEVVTAITNLLQINTLIHQDPTQPHKCASILHILDLKMSDGLYLARKIGR